jgi:para-aminobenzoate synthetase/4-amino-4-deoxychorismate lyase
MAKLRGDRPFVLFDDARPGSAGPSRLYANPVDEVRIASPREVRNGLRQVRQAQRGGRHVAGWLSYEAGLALEPRLAARASMRGVRTPLMWFGVFETCDVLDPPMTAAMLPDPAGAWVSDPRPAVTEQRYTHLIARVLEYIRAGDIYQLNLTFQNELKIAGDPLALYAQLRTAGAGGWGGVAFDGDTWLLSTSPELFFTLQDGVIEARPMKGTARRGLDAAADVAAARALAADPKQIAENLMIVDLLRNDISRVAAKASVSAPHLFTVETYPTLHALTSTVRARLGEGKDAVDALEALFPCGSITGAPKIRAMEIIDELEGETRGAYTGAMGWIAPGGDAAFNVLIRTLVTRAGESTATLGLGSGVVLDSVARSEWRECLDKGAFVTRQRAAFDLIETMRFEPSVGVCDLDLHLERLARSAEALGFACDVPAIQAIVLSASRALDRPHRVRLSLSMNGDAAIEVSPAPPAMDGEAVVALDALPVGPDDFRLRHKTSLRGFYDAARARTGAFEVVFTDVFATRDGRLATPPLFRGLLPGVLRAKLLAGGQAVEADLRREDLARGFFIGNAMRGLMPARLRD